MPSGVASNRIGSCPHGMPPGACPACNGMGGGGGSSAKKVSSEMSWDECYSIGQAMKQAKQNTELNKLTIENTLVQNSLLQRFASSMAEKFVDLKNFIIQTPIGQITAKIINNINTLTNKVFELPIKILNNILKTASNFIADISDKLAAMFGEKELSVKKFLSEAFDKAKQRFLMMFGFIEEVKEQSEESEKIIEEKRKIEKFEKLKVQITKFLKTFKETK